MIWQRLAFLGVYLLVYGFINLEIYRFARPILPQAQPVRWLFMAWLALMVAAPVLSRIFEHFGHIGIAAAFDVVGYWWMGFAFIGVLVYLVVWLAGLVLPFSSKTMTLAGLGLTLALFTYGFIAAANPGLTFVEIEADLPPGTERIRIAQITDQHLGYTMNSTRLANVCAMVAAQNPDIVVSTGDLLENVLPDADYALKPLKDLDPPLGKYAVFGNHETYMDAKAALDYHQRTGFKVLRDEAAVAGGKLSIGGMDYRNHLDPEKELAVLKKMQNGLPRLFLKHRPKVVDDGGRYFDLMLAGHTHAGQIWPFRYIVKMIFPMIEGEYKLPGGGIVFVSRGSGSWGPPVRLLAPPEVVIADLVPRNGKGK